MSVAHEVWASSSKSNNCGTNCKLAKRGNGDTPAQFQKIGRGDAKNGKIKFSNKRFSSEGYRLACPSDHSVLNATCSLQIKILFCRNSEIPCMKNLKILVKKSRDSHEFKKLVEKVKEIEDFSRSASNTISFFGSHEPNEEEVVVIDDEDETVTNDDIDDNLEIPPDYLDEITHEMMTMPMTLPSGKSVDRSTVEKCSESQEMWGGPARDPFTGQIFTKTLRPVFDSALKSRIDRFLLENGSRVGENLPRTVGSSEKISQFLEDKSRGIKRCYGGEIKKVTKSKDYLKNDLSSSENPSCSKSAPVRNNLDSVLSSAIRQLPPIVKTHNYRSSLVTKHKK